MNTTSKLISSRRQFLKTTAAGSGLAASVGFPSLHAADANKKIAVAVIGLGRGHAHLNSYLAIPNVEIAYVCDVDSQRIDRALATVAKKQATKPQGVKDFRRILDDKSVDAVSIATPNFWHAPMTTLACAAGKHVYVEKPGSGTAREGELMVAAARKHNRVVQLGTQRRSMPGIIEGIEKLRAGVIGPVRFARCWYDNLRPSIGIGKVAPVPEWLDYNLWQGPLPERPYKDNLVHYNWHWMWHWGNGELGNNGPHAIDVARWGLGVDAPRRVTCNGGRYHHQDDQETPDTSVVAFDFGDKGLTWENSSAQPRASEKNGFVSFYGDGGTMAMSGNAWEVFDLKGKPVEKGTGSASDVPHFTNFIEAIRIGEKLRAEIAVGQASTLLCHLGNLAYRTGHTLHLDPKTGKILNDPAATALWTREYRKGWEPKG